MRTTRLFSVAIPFVAMLISSRADALLSLTSCSSTTACTNQSVCLTTTAPIAGGIDDYYEWTLERDGAYYYLGSTWTDEQQISFNLTNANYGSGNYKIHLDAWIYDYALDTYWGYSDTSNSVPVTFQSATASSKINNSSSQTPNVYANGPMTLNGSGSACASSYFVSIQKSNSSWGGTGPECMRWLTSSDYNQFGSISNFDLRGFYLSCGQTFTPGQYYRVKLAVGNPWNETVKLVYVPPATPNFSIKDKNNNWVTPPADGSPIEVCSSNITMNAAATMGESKYEIVVQESDRWWNRSYRYEWGRWFSGQAPNGINLQNLASTYSYPQYGFTGDVARQGSVLFGGNLQSGAERYFRVSLCTGEPSWTCKTALLRVIGSCLVSSPPETDNASSLLQDESTYLMETDLELLDEEPLMDE
jgi:hypothetical protein